MGAVYQAWDAELTEAVAVKVIRPEIAEDPLAAADIERRFKRELLLARQITHKNVVRIHDLGEIDGIKYITMTYVVGSDLATVLKEEGKLPVPRALRITRGIVSGLVSAHQAGVVHRDLKPANIMIGPDDAVTIMDFGIARSTGQDGQGADRRPPMSRPAKWAALAGPMAGQTMAGAIIGTVEYMAPEQGKGQPVDQRSDIYSLGLILYDVLVGRKRKHQGENALDELYARMEKAPPVSLLDRSHDTGTGQRDRHALSRARQRQALPDDGRIVVGAGPAGRERQAAADHEARQPADHGRGRRARARAPRRHVLRHEAG